VVAAAVVAQGHRALRLRSRVVVAVAAEAAARCASSLVVVVAVAELVQRPAVQKLAVVEQAARLAEPKLPLGQLICCRARTTCVPAVAPRLPALRRPDYRKGTPWN